MPFTSTLNSPPLPHLVAPQLDPQHYTASGPPSRLTAAVRGSKPAVDIVATGNLDGDDDMLVAGVGDGDDPSDPDVDGAAEGVFAFVFWSWKKLNVVDSLVASWGFSTWKRRRYKLNASVDPPIAFLFLSKITGWASGWGFLNGDIRLS